MIFIAILLDQVVRWCLCWDIPHAYSFSVFNCVSLQCRPRLYVGFRVETYHMHIPLVYSIVFHFNVGREAIVLWMGRQGQGENGRAFDQRLIAKHHRIVPNLGSVQGSYNFQFFSRTKIVWILDLAGLPGPVRKHHWRWLQTKLQKIPLWNPWNCREI